MKIISPDETKASPLYSALFQIQFFISMQNFRGRGYFTSKAPDRKSNPHVPDLPRTAGAENHYLTLESEIYIRNSQKLINFIWIF